MIPLEDELEEGQIHLQVAGSCIQFDTQSDAQIIPEEELEEVVQSHIHVSGFGTHIMLGPVKGQSITPHPELELEEDELEEVVHSHRHVTGFCIQIKPGPPKGQAISTQPEEGAQIRL